VEWCIPLSDEYHLQDSCAAVFQIAGPRDSVCLSWMIKVIRNDRNFVYLDFIGNNDHFADGAHTNSCIFTSCILRRTKYCGIGVCVTGWLPLVSV